MRGSCMRTRGKTPRPNWARLCRRTAVAAVSLVVAAPAVAAGAVNVPVQGGVRQVVATAYCLDGHMANGEPTHDGAAAMRGVPLGTSVTILDGPDAGRAVVVKDRLRKRGVLDIWMDDCGAARQHGARLITVEIAL